jgi:hypothetical protein
MMGLSERETSSKSDDISNENDFVNKEMQEARESCNKLCTPNSNLVEFRKKKPSIDKVDKVFNQKNSHKKNESLMKSSEKKRRHSSFLNKVLKDIKSNKQINN